VLWFTRPASAHAIGQFWQGDAREFAGWYGNLQAPLLRTAVGFDTADHVLDIDITPARTWRLKDEDEFAAAQRLGHLSRAEAAAIRAEGENVIAALEQGASPFNAGWEAWRPDPTWSTPTFLQGWDIA
jgi:predicted RNA-binding protein associated with RNAse of E/G family